MQFELTTSQLALIQEALFEQATTLYDEIESKTLCRDMSMEEVKKLYDHTLDTAHVIKKYYDESKAKDISEGIFTL